jgi:ABC-type transporter Mla maintaining outer membrane lipid asymmetry permease subunit MlaE
VKNTLEQLKLVGPRSLGVALLTAGFVGMVFTIQVCSLHGCALLLQF